MAELLRIPVGEDSKGQLVVEVPDDDPGIERASRARDSIRQAATSLQDALEPIREAAETALETFRAAGPHTVEIEFGVKLNASAGAVLTSVGAEGHLVVTLSWAKESL